jgi:predicted amidohydrolase YtcJ
MQCPAAEIKDIKPLLTVIGGKILYRNPSLAN